MSIRELNAVDTKLLSAPHTPSLSIPISPILVIQLRTISIEMSRISTLKTTISPGVWPIAASIISSIGVASAPAIAGIVSYLAAFMTLQSARARVIALALGCISLIEVVSASRSVVIPNFQIS
nr:hypothetical protein [Tanacetum cinerariifolium]